MRPKFAQVGRAHGSPKIQRYIQENYHIWKCLQYPSSFYLKGSLGSTKTSIKTKAANGNISTLREFLVFIVFMPQTLHAKYLNGFKPNFVVLTVFLKKSVSDLNYILILW